MAETKLSLNLVIDKNSQKVIYAEVGKTFVDFLFHLLTLPFGAVIMQLTEKGMMGCLGDLYESVENLSETCMQHGQSKDPLVRPICNWSSCLPTPKKFYVCWQSCSTLADHPSAVCTSCRGTMSRQASYISEVKKKIGLPMVGGYVKEGLTYMVTDALVVKPLSTKSIVELLSKSNINDVGGALEEKVVDFTLQESCMIGFEAADRRIIPVRNCLDECLPWEYRPGAGIKSFRCKNRNKGFSLQELYMLDFQCCF